MSTSILKYFKLVKPAADHLPDPEGTLSSKLPSLAIASANSEVRSVMATSNSRGPYLHLTPAQKFQIGKRASERGVTNTIGYYKKNFPNLSLKETSVRRFKDSYRELVKKRTRDDTQDELEELPTKKLGRPLLLGEEIDRQVKEYLKYLREQGSAVNTIVAIATAEGVVRSVGANLLAYNGGGIHLTKAWARSLLNRMGMVKRRVSGKAKIDIHNFVRIKEEFLLDVKNVISMDKIPPSLVINWDQTAIQYVPISSWTMEQEGAKRVKITGKDDKRQITAVLACTMSGDVLLPQLVYQGKTPRCLPQVEFPKQWHITYTENHWCNEITMKEYINKIVLPYVKQKRRDLKLSIDYPALVIFDNFKGQCTKELLTTLDSNNINVILIPANYTDRLQPLDISVNKSVKEFLHAKFQEWYSKKICSQLKGEKEKSPIDLCLSVLKPEGAKWMICTHDYLSSKPDIITNGFKDIKNCLAQ